MHKIKSVIFGVRGLTLSPEEADFFREINPLGFIIFDRNVKDPEQLRQLTAALRTCVGRTDAPILVDQEGGRVQRLWPPYWPGLPFAQTYGDWYLETAKKGMNGVREHARTLSKILLDVGIDVDCWPCLDVAAPGVHDVMGKRLFGSDPVIVSLLAKEAVREMLSRGLMPVIKHLPGYGRAETDPHHYLPIVRSDITELERDFYPFRQIKQPVWGMTAHVLYEALDPTLPATLSEKVIRFIREEIGFSGFLISDDITMGALGGSVADKAAASIDAGCDAVLHCSGILSEMEPVAKKIPSLSADARKRLQQGRALIK